MNVKWDGKPHCQRCKRTGIPLHKNTVSKFGISYMCRDCNRERQNKYRHTEEGKKKVYRSIYASEKRNPERKRAQSRVHYALKTGVLIRPSFCEICKKSCKPEGHHEDYEKKLEVKWVCKSCHVDLDNSRRNRLAVLSN